MIGSQIQRIGSEHRAAILVIYGADLDARDNKWGETPLHVGARYSAGCAMGVLIRGGADVNAKTVEGKTPLHCAAEVGYEDGVRILLKYGGSVGIKDKHGKRPRSTMPGQKATRRS